MADFDFADPKVLVAIGLGALVFVLLVFIVMVVRRRKPAVHPSPDVPAIDVLQLGSHGPPTGGTQLECYGAPVRIAALVVAPMGTGGGFPNLDQLPTILDRIVPGMGEILVRDQPLIRVWPPQLSPGGFSNSFFGKARLPGERGQGTPWCSVSGKYLDGKIRLLLGVVLCATTANSLGEFTVDQPTQWMDLLRIRRNA